MKSFSKLYSDFWTSHNNLKIANTGIDGQLLALYLQSNAHCNALGAYYLPIPYISSDIRLPVKQTQIALKKLCQINYCKYDTKTQYVWVCNLASEQIGKIIDARDNRVISLQAIWKSLPPAFEFLEEIYQKYHTTFYLEQRSFEKTLKADEAKTEAIPKTNISSLNWFRSLSSILSWNNK